MTHPGKRDTIARARRGEALSGTLFNLGSPDLCDAAAMCPLDFCVLDWEHGLWNELNLPPAIRVLEESPMLCIVRVPSVGGPWIKKALDWGADGVIVPGVKDFAEAQHCVAEGKYAPLGRRGVGPLRESRYYTRLHECVRQGNERTLLWLMIETSSLVEDLARVCALEGVDGFVIGRNDLSQSLGRPFAEWRDQTEAMAMRAQEICVAAGKPVGSFGGTADDVVRWAGAGATIFVVGDDAQFARDGMAAVAEMIGRQAAAPVRGY
jgi:4-hydroxy-2-oxoheptanedioate aldolase